MKHTLLLTFATFCLLLFSPRSHAQVYRPGFIVKSEGDTLRGLVKYQENNRRYKTCTFRSSQGATSQDFEPTEIVAYGFSNDALFERKSVPDGKGSLTNVFAEVLAHGRLSLYKYKSQLYLEKDDSGLKRVAVQADDLSSVRVASEQGVAKTSTSHLILINSLTYDCPVPEPLLKAVVGKIREQEMLRLVEAYNNCSAPNSNITYKQEKPWITVEKGILIGSHATKVRFSDGMHSAKISRFPTSHNPIAGAHFNIIWPRISERFSLQVDALYSPEHHQQTLHEVGGTYNFLRSEHSIQIKRLAAVTMARFSVINLRKANPYFALGVSHSYFINSLAQLRHEQVVTINGITYVDTNLSEKASVNARYHAGITGAVGTTFRYNDKHKFLFQARFERNGLLAGRIFENSETWARISSNSSLYLTAAYIFK